MSYIDDSKFQYNLKKEYFLELRILQLLLLLIGWQMKLRNLFLGGIIRLSAIMEEILRCLRRAIVISKQNMELKMKLYYMSYFVCYTSKTLLSIIHLSCESPII